MFYPLFLDLRGRRVLVVGGGTIAERKVESLLAADAAILLVAPEITSGLRKMSTSGAIQLQQRKFVEADLAGKVLVVSATDDCAVQEQVAAAARSRNIPINTVDQPDLCDFIVPAVIRKGDVVIAISTSGKSPTLAAELRNRIEKVVTDDAGRTAVILGVVRREVHARFPDPDRRKQVFESIVGSGILDWIGGCDDAAALERVRSMIENLA